MSTHALGHAGMHRRAAGVASAWTHAAWFAGGLALGFALPFLLVDTLGLDRDLFYGLYGAAVLAYVAAWGRATGQSWRAAIRKRRRLTAALTVVAGIVLVLIVYRTEDATSRPDGIEYVAALLWRGVFDGASDGILLSVFPILAVFAALAARSCGTGAASC